MRAVVVHESGPPENLKLEEREKPKVRKGTVLVRVRAEGVCYRDVVERRGGFDFIKRPVTPGHEFAGEVVEMGEGVEGLQVGQRVVNLHREPCGTCDMCRSGHEPRCRNSMHLFGLSADGGYAEYVLCPSGALVHLSERVPFTSACFLGCTAGVALRGLRTIGGVSKGDTVMVTGAGGGVGIHAIQVAKVLGARVIAVTSTASKRDALAEYGADEILVPEDNAFHKQIKRMTKGKGVDVALDCVGTPTLNAALRSLAPRGRLVVVGNVTTDRFEINPGYLILAELSIAGSAGCCRADLLQVLRWVEEGKLRPVVAEVLKLDDAPEAHRRLEEKSVLGRLVLEP